jgi:hypothetical protein
MAGYLFNAGAYGLLHGDIAFGTDVIKARLSRTSETPDKDATSMTGLGLSATALSLGTKTGPTKDDSTDRVKYGSANPTFSAVASGAEVNKMILCKYVTDDAGSTPIAVVEFTPVVPNGGDITVSVNAAGLFYLQD